RPARRRRAARRVAAEQEVDVLALALEQAYELVDEAALADPGLALHEDDLPLSGLREAEQSAELRDLGVPPDERRFARDADAAQRPVRRRADLGGPPAPPGRLLALFQDLRHFRGVPDALLPVFLDELRHQLLEEGRELRVEFAGPPRRRVQ